MHKGKARRANFGLWKKSYRKQPEAPQLDLYLTHLPVVCKTGGMSVLLSLQLQCRWCDVEFCICRRCFRGQAYCSDGCRLSCRRKNHREAQRRYRQTEKGKKGHREAENRRRHGLTQKNRKNMDDQSSTALPTWCMRQVKAVKSRFLHMGTTVRCHFCGSPGLLVEHFPRRGYG